MTKLEQDLLALVYEHDGSVGNGKARERLGLDEADYEQLKAAVVARGWVKNGRGQGGSLQLLITKAEVEKLLFEPVEEVASGQEARGAQQVATGPQANRLTGPKAHKPVAGNQRTAGPVKPVTKDLEATGQQAIRPIGQKANKPEAGNLVAETPMNPRTTGLKASQPVPVTYHNYDLHSGKVHNTGLGHSVSYMIPLADFSISFLF